MTRIGVISDTHSAGPTRELASLVNPGAVFGDADLIFHAGDLTNLGVLDAFYPKKVVAVCGNMDGHDVSGRLKAKEIVEVDGFRFGLIHGWGSREGLEHRIFPEFADSEVDAIIYGHTHTPANHLRAGVLLFNPGSFLSGTVGVLRIDDKIQGEIVRL